MSKTDEAPGEDVEDVDAPKKRSRRPLLLGVVLFLLLGGAGFYAAYSGIAPNPLGVAKSTQDAAHEEVAHNGADAALPAFVALDELVIPLGPASSSTFLAIATQIEVDPKDQAAFEGLKPRFHDVLNTFLRAVQLSDLEEPSAMLRLRAQLLRRISAVAAPARPRDFLITSFVLQ